MEKDRQKRRRKGKGGGGNWARKSWRLNHGSQTDLYIPTSTLGNMYAFAFTAPNLSHHHFFPLFPRFYLTLNKTNTLVWTQGVCKPANTKSHLHTCRLHKRAVVFTIFQISESHAVSLHYQIYKCMQMYTYKYKSWKAPRKQMWSSHASFLLHSVCVCRIQDPVLVHLGLFIHF